ncbi:MAG: putative addiction module antidote protein [Methylobacillus sp.]|nr:putative addiction module antidote protein [Methylobacillus sp.]
MTKKIKISELREFDVAEHLDSEEAIAEYLTIVLEENDPAALADALGDVARARGMTQMARDTGLSRESLYKGLSGNRIPSTDTLMRVISALGLQLAVRPRPEVATG